LKRSAIGPNRWARFYELQTNRPIYGDRDGRIHYTLEEISEERRTGYSWQGEYGVRAMIAEYRRLASGQLLAPAATADRRAVRAALDALDASGRWKDGSTIRSQTFIRHMATLCRFLEANGRNAAP